jgi:hypothetical protein
MENDTSKDTSDSFAGFGVPRTQSGPREYPWRRQTLKTPDSNKGETQTRFVGRIIPPFKSLANNPRGWAHYHDLFFGYDGLSKNNPSKNRMRPFVVKDCRRDENPAQKKITDQQAKLESLYDSLAKLDKSEAEVKKETQPLVDWLRYHNRDSKWYLNMVGEDGEIYVLQITNKCKKDLELEMSKLEAQGYSIADIMNPKGGVWFEFIRTGSRLKVGEIQDKVSVVREVQTFTGANGQPQKAEVIKSAALTQPQIDKVLANAPDLALETVNFLTKDQAQRLVDGPADPSFVDSIWGDLPLSQTATVKTPVSTTIAPETVEAKKDAFFKAFGG